MKQIRKRLTYANVMSSIAVFLVLGGATAFAASQLGKNSVGAKQLKSNAVTTGKIKREAITNGKIKKGTITGSSLNLGALGTVPNATNAAHANVADVGSPRAYARVLNHNGGGGVEEAKSKGISDASVTYGGGSVYCFELGFTPTNVQASVDWIGGSTGTAQPDLGEYSLCPAGTDASVRTTDSGAAGTDKINFFISFFG